MMIIYVCIEGNDVNISAHELYDELPRDLNIQVGGESIQ